MRFGKWTHKIIAVGMLLAAAMAAKASASEAQTIDSWDVQVIFPEVQFNQFANWIVGFAASQAGGPSGAGTVIMKGMRWLYGGTPVAGTLTLKIDGLHFESNSFAAFLYYDNAPAKIFIPLRDIRSAYADPSLLGMSIYVITPPEAYVETSKGRVSIISQFSSYFIAQEINDLLKQRAGR